MRNVSGCLGFVIACTLPAHLAQAGQINEVMAGFNGDSAIQFVELSAAADQTLWPAAGESTGRVMLEFFDAADRLTGRFVLAGSPAGAASTVLIATPKFAQLPGAPVPDFIMPPNVNAHHGKVCLRGNPDSGLVVMSECVAYGSADITLSAAPALPILGAQSLSRRDTALVLAPPTPANSSAPDVADFSTNQVGNGSFIFAPADLATQGNNLFTLETFGGNGRTCSTCHVAPLFNLTPQHVQQRAADDPLFVGDAQRNINTLNVTHAGSTTGFPQPSDLRGEIQDNSGHRARVVAGSGRAYLIDGGQSLSGVVTDSFGNTATVTEVIAGNLAGPNPANGDVLGIEDPTGRRLRSSTAPAFANGRALIVENIDGFDNPAVFRKSPHLLNIKDTAPFGLSGEFGNLNDFTAQAVRQHYPLDLRRREGTDFRLPTTEELAALVAFQESIARVPPALGDGAIEDILAVLQRKPGTSPSDVEDLNHLLVSFGSVAGNVTTQLQFDGLVEFSTVGCRACHFDRLLASTSAAPAPAPTGPDGSTPEIPPPPAPGPGDGTVDVSGSAPPAAPPALPFDTGVTHLPINRADDLRLDRAPGLTTRAMSVPPLVGIRHTAPYFHDNSAATLEEAVAFYNTPEFKTAAAANFPGISGLLEIPDFQVPSAGLESLVAFLRTLTAYPFTFTRQLGFGELAVGEQAIQAFTLSNEGERPLRVAATRFTGSLFAAQLSGLNQFFLVDELTDAVVEPGTSREFQVAFHANSDSPADAILELRLDDGVDTWDIGIALAADGLAAVTHDTVFLDQRTRQPMPATIDLVIEATGRKTPVLIPFGIAKDSDGIASVTNNAPSDGRYRLGLTVVTQVATDNLGNPTTQTFNVTVQDTTAPTIKRPKPVQVTTDAAQVHVELTPPRVFDAVGIKSIANNAPAFFTPGTHRIIWTARDRAGNVSRAKQRVVVIAVPATVAVEGSNR